MNINEHEYKKFLSLEVQIFLKIMSRESAKYYSNFCSELVYSLHMISNLLSITEI